MAWEQICIVLIIRWSSWWIWYNIVQFPIYLGLKGDPIFLGLVCFSLWHGNIIIQIRIHFYITEFCFWVINAFCLVLQFVTVILSHLIATCNCNFTKVLFPPNFGVSCSKRITTTSLKLASSPYTVCIVIIHISAKITPPWQEPNCKEEREDASKVKAPTKQG
jgi:hypothetical protein